MVLLMMDWNTREAPPMENAVISMTTSLGGADLHGIGKQLGIGEIHPHQHVARGAEKNNGGQDQEFAPVGADGSRIHRSAPPFRLGMAEQQLVPALPRRMALRPYLSR